MERLEIENALEELGRTCEARGIHGRVQVVGGAAMLLLFDSRVATDDIDAGVYPKDPILEVAREIGERRGLGSKWLNDDAKIFISPVRPPSWQLVRTIGTIEVWAADPRSLLGMKLRASRGQRDQLDVTVLLRECGIDTVEQAIALFEEYYPDDRLPSQAEAMIRFGLAQGPDGERNTF